MKKLTTDLRPNAPREEEETPSQEETVIDGIEEEEKEEQKFNVRLTVWVGRESTRIAMGEATAQQVQHVIATLNSPFDALAASKGLILTDAKNVTHIFNAALVTHIEVEVD